MRYYFLLLILIVVGACNNSSPQPTLTPASIEVKQTSISTSVQVTPTLIPTPANKKVEAQPTVTPRAFENGLPLAARVNDQPLFLDTYEKQLAQFEQVLKAQGVDLTSNEGQDKLNHIRQQVLEGLLTQLIIEQQANNLGIIVTKTEVKNRAQEVIDQLEEHEQFEVWLIDNNLTYREFITNLQSQLIAKRLFDHITQNLPNTAEQIRLRIIREENKDAVKTLIEQLRNGANFAKLAQEFSRDDSSRANAGDLGWFPKNAGLVPLPVEEIAFSLQPGEVSGPIQTSLGFYIIKLENKEEKRSLTNEMLFILKKQIFDDWLMEQLSLAVVERYVAL